MPVFNADRYVKQAIQSIRDQTYQSWELHICDDASEDASWQIIQHCSKLDSRINIYRNNVNKGKVATVNSLLRSCRGKYLTIHDADDWSEKNRFELQLKTLKERSIKMCGCSFNIVNKDGSFLKPVIMQSSYSKIVEGLNSGSQFHGPTMIFETDIIEDIGGLYRAFLHAEDVDLSQRISENFVTTNLKATLYNYRIHKDSLTNRVDLIDDERFINFEIMRILKNQREKFGSDVLMEGKDWEYRELKNKLKHKYNSNPTLKYDQAIARFISIGLYGAAIHTFFICIRRHPFNLKTYITFKNMLFSMYLRRKVIV
ncbi:glycosyltransferase family 2 protein [Marivirga salinae]|uniref:Glycosyltransferase family 2 protein n=1 Tax=Marivirga salinarum TaxID=3059078 RepID=A0AA49JGY0_9BACT|nr:glycosyltransferase family 2 protein [Marivirga sp. BDSF4-3]WKK76880.2 glycosyltransferase family 2 protein [Marivirga sp. BDSF4-3]